MSIQPPKYSCGPSTASIGYCIAAMFLMLLAGCQSGPPVQEMSDARQAIQVAKQAGADLKAAAEIKQAEAHLDRAEERIAKRAYAQARREAEQAKRSALHALSIAGELPKVDPR